MPRAKSTFHHLPTLRKTSKFYDVSGKLVHNEPLLKSETSFIWRPSNDIPAGIYLVKVVGKSSAKSIRTVYLK
jgi:hypothetical protein